MPGYSASESLLLILLWAMGCLLMWLLTNSAYCGVTHRQFRIYIDISLKQLLHQKKNKLKKEKRAPRLPQSSLRTILHLANSFGVLNVQLHVSFTVTHFCRLD